MYPDADTPELRNEIAAVFDNTIVLKNREEQNSTLYRMLNTENLATYLIFTLVLIIALFNVVGAIIMMILDKNKTPKHFTVWAPLSKTCEESILSRA